MAILACALVLLACPGAQERTGGGTPADVFAIYLLAEPVDPRITGYGQGDWSRLRLASSPLITGNDLVSYDWSTHAMKLRREAVARIRHPPVGGTPFVVVAEGQRIYLGLFITIFSSHSFAVPAIVTDAQISPTQPTDTLVIARAYPTSSFGRGPDPRSDERIKIALTKLGKAKASIVGAQVKPSVGEPQAHVFASPGGVDLKAYVFSPVADDGRVPRPAIVLFYGGGWAQGEPAWAFTRARHFAEQGMVAVAAEYRLSDQKSITPIEAMADARAVIRWMRAQASSLKIDPRRIAAYGWSAGAHLAASAAIFADTVAGEDSARPDALVLVSPAVSLVSDQWFQRLLGTRGNARDFSPDLHVRAGLPPTLILQGSTDTVTPLPGVRRFCEQLVAARNRCEMHVYEQYGHLFTPAGIPDDGQPQPDPGIAADALARADRFLKSLGFQSSGAR